MHVHGSLPPTRCPRLTRGPRPQVRVNNLQELVYKQGQAGVTKATVSIVFDNSDKAPGKSPVGYEHLDEITVTRQLVIGGRSKYLINGKAAEPRWGALCVCVHMRACVHACVWEGGRRVKCNAHMGGW